MVVSSPTVQSVNMAFGPISQPAPMCVRPRRIVPGRIVTPGATVQRGST